MSHPDIEKILIDSSNIDLIVSEIADRINKDYANSKGLILVPLLTGAAIFACDLIKKIKVPVSIHFMSASSYGSSTVTSGNVKIRLDILIDIKDKDVLVVEDILDTGLTLKKILDLLTTRNPSSLEVACFLKKPKQDIMINVKYVGKQIENNFVVGYGLDYNERYRELPFIGILKPSVYS